MLGTLQLTSAIPNATANSPLLKAIDGTNRYTYARNNPVGFVDPTGYFSEDAGSEWMSWDDDFADVEVPEFVTMDWSDFQGYPAGARSIFDKWIHGDPLGAPAPKSQFPLEGEQFPD